MLGAGVGQGPHAGDPPAAISFDVGPDPLGELPEREGHLGAAAGVPARASKATSSSRWPNWP